MSREGAPWVGGARVPSGLTGRGWGLTGELHRGMVEFRKSDIAVAPVERPTDLFGLQGLADLEVRITLIQRTDLLLRRAARASMGSLRCAGGWP